ncbi:MAG: hypothetical protein M1819_000403 [Sarea resinae]|nr:MAG: hypothetical protein M1819_000403 [Sarea resinae]
MCANQIVNGVTKDGGFAEYEILHTSAAVRIPAGIDPAKAAPLLCAGVTVFASIRKQHTPPGSTVVVVGLGGLGHLAVQYAAKMGYHVVAISSSSSKASFAHQLGAHDYIDTSKQDLVETLNAMGGAALIVYTAPSPKLLPSLLNTFQPAGKLLVLSPCGDFPVSSAILIQKGVSVTGYATGTALDNEEAIAFAERHGVECLIEKFPLAEAQKALEHTKSGNVRFRSVLVM